MRNGVYKEYSISVSVWLYLIVKAEAMSSRKKLFIPVDINIYSGKIERMFCKLICSLAKQKKMTCMSLPSPPPPPPLPHSLPVSL